MDRPVALPPFEKVIKSREVEDPVNIWVHRRLAYGFVALIHRTAVTPNQVTFLAMIVGIAAGCCWFVGTPTLMIVGGALLWTSAILDGADGILARAKQVQSELGRAFDGMADMVVAASTVLAAFYHLWVTHQSMLHLPLMVVALGMSVVQIFVYDYYKEFFLDAVNPSWDGRSRMLADVKARYEAAKAEGASLLVRSSWDTYVNMLEGQVAIVKRTNPEGVRHTRCWPAGDRTAEIYRKHNYWPMRLWVSVSLCPHTYLLAICGMFDRLDVYLWFRAVGVNVIFVIAVIWQRIATNRTIAELEQSGAGPTEVESSQ